MARKEMDAILSAEKSAAEGLEDAKIRAKETVAAAEKQAAAVVEEAVRGAQEEAQAIATKVAQESAALEERVTVQARTEIERIQKSADSRRGEAVDAVVKRVLKAIS